MEQLGIESKLLIAQVVNFLIIAFVLQKLLYKPILGILEKRKKQIEEGLALTEKMRSEEEKLKQKQDKLLSATRVQAQGIIEDAKKQAKEQEKEIIADAHNQAQGLIERAKLEIERLHKQMESDVRREAIELAATMTKRLTASILGTKDHHRLIADKLKKLESLAAKRS
mgnify:CR=1 FL=1